MFCWHYIFENLCFKEDFICTSLICTHVGIACVHVCIACVHVCIVCVHVCFACVFVMLCTCVFSPFMVCFTFFVLLFTCWFYLCFFTCVTLLVLPVFFFNSVHLLVLSVFLYFCHLCVSTIMVYFCTSACFYLWWSWSWSSSFPGCPPVPWCWWWNTLVYRSVLCYDLLLSPETHQQVITASQKHYHQITPTDSVVCFGCFIFLSLLNFLFSYYQLFT